MRLNCLNVPEFRKWLRRQRRRGYDVEAIREDAPPGLTYDDGSLIKQPIARAWRSPEGTFTLRYQHDTEQTR